MKTFKSFINISILCALFIAPLSHAMEKLALPDYEDKVIGSILGGCIGDALGFPIEKENFSKHHDIKISLANYKGGIGCYDDVKKFHTKKNPLLLPNGIAPYTDDTAMARVTLEVLLQARNMSWNRDNLMSELAMAYLYDKDFNPNGWAKSARAPGGNTMAAIGRVESFIKAYSDPLKDLFRHQPSWWENGLASAGSCGSVMRSHVFGLAYADNPKLAADLAADHSKITHGHKEAIAACAAMAYGTGWAIQGKDPNYIVDAMIEKAREYDNDGTGSALSDVKARAEGIKHKLRDRKLNGKDLQQFLFDESKQTFKDYPGWGAKDALASAMYIFALASNDIKLAWYLGVQTPGDSDSIASMAAALVGALVGFKKLQQAEPNWNKYEGSKELQELSRNTARLLQGQKLPEEKLYSEKLLQKMREAKNQRNRRIEKVITEYQHHLHQSSPTYFYWGLGFAVAATAALLYWWYK